jgi:hypothetical protein
VLRKLLRLLWKSDGMLDHPFFQDQIARQERLRDLYAKLKAKHPDKTPAWWFDTHGIEVAGMDASTKGRL